VERDLACQFLDERKAKTSAGKLRFGKGSREGERELYHDWTVFTFALLFKIRPLFLALFLLLLFPCLLCLFFSPRIDRIWITRLVCCSFRLCTDWEGVKWHGLCRNSATTTIGRSSCPGCHPKCKAPATIPRSLTTRSGFRKSHRPRRARPKEVHKVSTPACSCSRPSQAAPLLACGVSLHLVMLFVTLVILVILSPQHAPHGTTDERAWR
jgi:hypothetical protein